MKVSLAVRLHESSLKNGMHSNFQELALYDNLRREGEPVAIRD